jgi:hypothetical protein
MRSDLKEDAQIGKLCEGRKAGMKLLTELWTALTIPDRRSSSSRAPWISGTGPIRLSGARTLGEGPFSNST